jgi:hypothetical protein
LINPDSLPLMARIEIGIVPARQGYMVVHRCCSPDGVFALLDHPPIFFANLEAAERGCSDAYEELRAAMIEARSRGRSHADVIWREQPLSVEDYIEPLERSGMADPRSTVRANAPPSAVTDNRAQG